jgi:uncharacterized protein (TIRG00374 family)
MFGFIRIPWIRTAAKVSLAAALLIWMIISGRLDLSRLAGTTAHWPQLLAIVTIFYVEVYVMAWRWNLLLGAQGLQLSSQQAFSLTMIGCLFNVVIPGTVGGDAIRGYYVGRLAAGRTPEALATILMDRVVGLLGLVALTAAAGIGNFEMTLQSRALGTLCSFAIVLAAFGGLGLALAVATGGRSVILERWRANRWVASLIKAAGTLTPYRRNPRLLPIALAASIFNQALSCLAFYFAVRALEGPPVPWRYFFFLVPLGLMTSALPISPAGLGVGQAAFFTLFTMIPGSSGKLGADACTVVQVLLILVYSTGFYSYLAYKHTMEGEIPTRMVSS